MQENNLEVSGPQAKSQTSGQIIYLFVILETHGRDWGVSIIFIYCICSYVMKQLPPLKDCFLYWPNVDQRDR